MSLGTPFCPRCGKETEKLVNGFCLDCLLEKGKLFFLPEMVEATQCTACSKLKFRQNWVEPKQEVFQKIISANASFKGLSKPFIALEGIELSEKEGSASVAVNGIVAGKKISVKKGVKIKILRTVCPSCSRVAGSYFEAVIQARFEKRTAKKEIQKRFVQVTKFLDSNARKDSLSKVVKTAFVSNGFDFWVGSKKASVKTVRHFEPVLKEKPKVSFKLHGWDLTKNRPQKRFTFLMRF